MIIIANTLAFNGGTTFILRLAKELSSRGERIAVLVLVSNINAELKADIERYADVYLLANYLHPILKWSWRSQLAIFLPFRVKRIEKLFSYYDGHIHVMGIFGLLFAALCVKRLSTDLNVSIGVYHQNEFMFRGHNYFAHEAQRLFQAMNPCAIVFFNESNKSSYEKYFQISYESSILVPIGIELPLMKKHLNGSVYSYRIVSIGNLYAFKTYNLHIINCLPDLIEINPKFSYEIYGEGEWHDVLEALIKEKGLEDYVSLNGRVRYSNFADVLSGAFLFVGSGTAILEAGALGIPSLIGIESMMQPMTYGFLSDIEGFSYNEFTTSQEQIPIIEKIKSITSSPEQWNHIAKACKKKAGSFSIKKTADNFQNFSNATLLSIDDVKQLSNLRLLISFVAAGIKYKLRLDSEFSNRRNQGSVV